ncbi:MAG TPA: DNA-processing protein DprA [Candidatus Saccharimonadales bacterium]|nr:DNA-processing protein DprA [Candidatus Saccharimonadales bacterium]
MDELDISQEERRYWLALSVCDGIGPKRFQKLLHHFESAQIAWHATKEELCESGIGERVSEDLIVFRETFSIEEYEERMAKLGIEYFTLQDSTYPKLLKASNNPPIVLYKKGTLSFNDNDILISIVGTRRVTEYGREVTEFLVRDLVDAGCMIVSGLAMGVDAIAHSSTLAVGGKTIAVLGSGVDICTPAENTRLYNSILENGGAILSENPLGRMPNKGSFPMRNRIIAGLSRGVVVTEGSEDSGSLITANNAFENDRLVFAVPGPITSSVSKGPISLIARGAKMVMSAKDILEEFNIPNIKGTKGIKRIKGLTKEEKKIVDVLQDQQLHFDELVKRTNFSSSQLGTLLSLMEMKGMIKSFESGVFGLTT